MKNEPNQLDNSELEAVTGDVGQLRDAVCPRCGCTEFQLNVNHGDFLDCRCKHCGYTVGIPRTNGWSWPKSR